MTTSSSTGSQQLDTPLSRFEDSVEEWSSEFESSVAGLIYCKSTTSDEERFRLINSFMEEYSFPVPISADLNGKSETRSKAAREEGNLNFAKKKWQKALQAYNQALCLAPNSHEGYSGETASPSLALAYGNRSAVFFNQGRYLECVLDVELAEKHGYPIKKLGKLLLRQAKSFLAMEQFSDAVACLGRFAGNTDLSKLFSQSTDQAELIRLTKRAKERLELQRAVDGTAPPNQLLHLNGPMSLEKLKLYHLAGGPHGDFPSISAHVGLSSSRSIGKHFVACKSLAPEGEKLSSILIAMKSYKSPDHRKLFSDIVLKQAVYVSAVLESKSGYNCLSCTVWTDMPIPCKTCANVVFCSTECASGEKADLHAKECPQFWKFLSGVESSAPRMIEMRGLLLCVYRIFFMKTLDEWRAFSTNLPEKNDEAETRMALKSCFSSDDYELVYLLSAVETNGPMQAEEKIICGLGAWFVMSVLECTEGYQGMEPQLRNFLGGLAVRHMRSFCWRMSLVGDTISGVSYCDSKGFVAVATALTLNPAFNFIAQSCVSNVALTSFGDVLVACAIKPIRPGEVLVCGKGLKMDYSTFLKKDRRYGSLLATEQTLLACHCQACEEDWPVVTAHLRQPFYKIRCLSCSTRFSLPLVDFGEQQGKCSVCGSKTPSFFKYREFMSNLNSPHWNTSAGFRELMQLIQEMSVYLVEPNAILGAVRRIIRNVWGLQGNTRPLGDIEAHLSN